MLGGRALLALSRVYAQVMISDFVHDLVASPKVVDMTCRINVHVSQRP